MPQKLENDVHVCMVIALYDSRKRSNFSICREIKLSVLTPHIIVLVKLFSASLPSQTKVKLFLPFRTFLSILQFSFQVRFTHILQN